MNFSAYSPQTAAARRFQPDATGLDKIRPSGPPTRSPSRSGSPPTRRGSWAPSTPPTLTAQGNLAASYRQAGRTADAIAIEERVAAEMARALGTEHR